MIRTASSCHTRLCSLSGTVARLRQSQLRQQLKAASVQSGPNAVSVLRVMTGAATVLLGMIAVIAALVAAVIGIVDQLLTGAVIGTGIVVATATEGQIVEAIAAPLTVDVTVATASLNS